MYLKQIYLHFKPNVSRYILGILFSAEEFGAGAQKEIIVNIEE